MPGDTMHNEKQPVLKTLTGTNAAFMERDERIAEAMAEGWTIKSIHTTGGFERYLVVMVREQVLEAVLDSTVAKSNSVKRAQKGKFPQVK